MIDVEVTKKEKVEIDPNRVENLLEQGKTKEEIRSELFPELNRNQWNKALKVMKLSSKRAKKTDFIII